MPSPKELFKLLRTISRPQFILTPSGKFLEVDRDCPLVFGFETPEDFMRCASLGSLCCSTQLGEAFLRKMEKDGIVEDFVIEMKRKDGTTFCASISAQTVKEGGGIFYRGCVLDVTQVMQWHRALLECEKLNEHLRESGERTRRLNQYILQMLMIMSHDIRGPLVAMAATLKLLIRGVYGTMDESVTKTLQDLLSRVVRLHGIAEDCLGRAQSVEGSVEVVKEVFDLRQDIIDPVLDELANEIQEREITIDNRLGAIPAGAIRVSVNKVWLKMVYRNLFSNAIKYGGRGCTIAFGFEDHGDKYRLNVYNSGKVVPVEHRDKLFTRFYRVETGDKTASDGVGLGLYLIREIIRKHGGDIWYEDRGHGSDFVFTLEK
ncbi:MAG: PAS domain-containing sensor histidine kinase [Syntrophobacteraceae bacterium]|nr:PAS domain-containing sensor histidine kinase [Syntrophobacteraceae bacterium]